MQSISDISRFGTCEECKFFYSSHFIVFFAVLSHDHFHCMSPFVGNFVIVSFPQILNFLLLENSEKKIEKNEGSSWNLVNN